MQQVYSGPHPNPLIQQHVFILTEFDIGQLNYVVYLHITCTGLILHQYPQVFEIFRSFSVVSPSVTTVAGYSESFAMTL